MYDATNSTAAVLHVHTDTVLRLKNIEVCIICVIFSFGVFMFQVMLLTIGALVHVKTRFAVFHL